MKLRLISVSTAASTNGRPTSTYADARPIAVSARMRRANCCRARTVSATMSKSAASEPPTWRWIVTAVITNEKFFEPTRSAISPSESSIGRPSCVSVSTRLNSRAAGSMPSSTTDWIPWRKL